MTLNKLKLSICIIFCCLSVLNISAGETPLFAVNKEDPFLEPHCTPLQGLPMWLLRQNATISAQETFIEGEFRINDQDKGYINRTRVESYVNIVNTGSFEMSLGARYITNSFQANSNQIHPEKVYHNWLWTGGIVTVGDRNRLIYSLEYSAQGENGSIYNTNGNYSIGALLLNHAFNKQWMVYGGLGYTLTEMKNESEIKPLPIIQGKYSNNKNFKVMFGFPILGAIEWMPTPKIGIGGDYTMGGGVSSFVRYRINSKISLSLNYKRTTNRTSKTFFGDYNYTNNGEIQTYNNLDQTFNKISLDIGIKAADNTGVIISAGYSIGEELQMNYNTKEVGRISGENMWFINFIFHRYSINSVL